jgi:hypothetical protein
VGWQSSYSRTFDGWQAKANLEKDKREEKALPDYSSTYVSREAENDVYRGSFRYNDLRKIPAQSNYTKDFGVFGDSPKDRIILNPDGTLDKYSLSKFSTSRDISHGRNGASVVPGYTGFLPRSGNAMNGKRPSKTLLTQTFTHNMPGYTGYKPSNVINDRGKRKPTSEQNAAVGMSAGLIVPSMSPAVLKARLAIQASGKKIALHHM